VEYTDPERFKIAQKDWASLSEKQRACNHDWSCLSRDIVKEHWIYQCATCGVRFNKKPGGPGPPRRSVEPTFRDQTEATR
jgi:hypothetical protein